jgi:two-component system, NtrC family, nitrogen regulation response regulator NtrX
MNEEMALRVLVVDDDPPVRGSLRRALEEAGHVVTEAGDGEGALAQLAERPADVVLLDINMPGLGGLDALPRIREAAPDTSVIMVTGEGTVANAMRAGQRGAYDFIEKPVDLAHLVGIVAEAGRLARLRRGLGAAAPAGPGEEAAAPFGMVGRSPALLALIEQVRRVAPAQGRVLITGENGAGKELVAHAIHELSKRAAAPFVKINCAAIPKDLVESELFGYERGAFTGAMQSKKGRLELADGGTLFLDEVGDLSLDAQAKLLRVIETGEVERVGGTRTTHVDVRIVAATNKDLGVALEDGDFRQDLYYRLNVLPLQVPALRERRGDVTLLAVHFLAASCRAEQRPSKRLTDEARGLLEDYHWPGNVRELRNLMERVAILVPGEDVTAEDIAPWLETAPGRAEPAGLRGEIERRESDAIRRALDGTGWNVTQAAASLGIDRTNLHRKMRKYGISRR